LPRQTSSTDGCSSCGSPLRPNTKFCTKCGNKV
jgi:predicted amidophosphoribosyltransferase